MSKPTTYDLVPYFSAPFLATHPDRLATVATLFGLKPRRADRCRVLELGCAGGGNLIPLAVALPESRFLGIDQSTRQVAEGQETIAGLGLKNIDMRVASILDVDASHGTFDYIICHGVYSWVAEEVQAKILDVCAHNLAPDGVGYVSYNTLPGWHMQGMIRDMMCYHISRAGNEAPENQVAQARALLNFLAGSVTGEKNPYTLLLQQSLERLQKTPDPYLFHEYLEECNEPLYFHEFCQRLTAKKLRYLGEADIRDMGTFRFPPEVRQVLGSLAPNQVQMEQYLDFLLNRGFRRSLICHQHHEPRYTLRPEQLVGFHIASCLRPKAQRPNLSPNVSEVFVGPNDTTLETGEPIFKAALWCLGETWPQTIAFEDLLRAARSRLGLPPSAPGAEADSLSLSVALLRVLTQSNWMVELWQCPPRFATAVSEQPAASPLARWQAPRQAKVTNLRHSLVPVSDFDRHILSLLDGTRDRPAILVSLRDHVRQGKLQPAQGGPASSAPSQAGAWLDQYLDQRLAEFARSALLVH